MPDFGRRSPEKPGNLANKKEREYFLKLYKKIQFLEFANVPFRGGKTNPLIQELKKLQSLSEKLPGEKLIKLYSKYLEEGLNEESPLVKRVFIGELLKKLDTGKNTEGMQKFMKLMIKETEKLQPLYVKQIKELASLLDAYPEYKEAFLNFSGLSRGKEAAQNIRPGDPVFDDRNGKGIEDVKEEYGPLEYVTPNLFAGEIMDTNKLDPFQIIFYKKVITEYNNFVKKIFKKIKPLLKYAPHPYDIKIKKIIYSAIHDMRVWIHETVEKMAVGKGKNLVSVYKKQVGKIAFPSIPKNIQIPLGNLAGKVSKKVKKIQEQLTNIRGKFEKKTKQNLLKGLDTIKVIQRFAPLIQDILSRKKMYRTYENRTFLNRFWQLAYRRYQNSSGDERLKYEFFTMVLDSIKSDNELVALIGKIKPMLIAILKNSDDAEDLSRSYFGKSFRQLSANEVNSILYLLLPSEKVTVLQKDTDEYKEMRNTVSAMINLFNLNKIKRENYPQYVAITTVSHNMLNIYTSISQAKTVEQAKKKLNKFIKSFETIRKLMDDETLRVIEAKSPQVAQLFKNPKKAVSLLKKKWFVPPVVKKAIRDFEKLHSLKNPPGAVALLKYAKGVRSELKKQQNYYKKLAFIRKRQKVKMDIRAIRTLKNIDEDIKKTEKAIQILASVWNKTDLKKNEKEIKRLLYSTRYLNVPPESRKYISFEAEGKKEIMSPDYNNLYDISNLMQIEINDTLKKLYSSQNKEYLHSRISPVVKNIFLSFGLQKEKQIKQKNISVYSYLKNNSADFASEISERINDFLKNAKLTDKNNESVKANYITGDLAGYLDKYIKSRILPKTKRAS
jgi:hypothetical protein